MKRKRESFNSEFYTRKIRKLEEKIEYINEEEENDMHDFFVELIEDKDCEILIFDYNFKHKKLEIVPIDLILDCEISYNFTNKGQTSFRRLCFSLPVTTGNEKIDKLLPDKIFEDGFVFEFDSGKELKEFAMKEVHRKCFKEEKVLWKPTDKMEGAKLYKLRMNLSKYLNSGNGLWAAYLKDE